VKMTKSRNVSMVNRGFYLFPDKFTDVRPQDPVSVVEVSPCM
jgi:hypothetical protein